MHALILPFINFSILVALLVYFLRQPLRSFVQQRHLNLKSELKRVRDLLQEAQDKHEEFSAKLKAIDVEVSTLREQVNQESQSAKLRILTEAQRIASHIANDARMAADTLIKDTKKEITRDFALRVLDRAEKHIKSRLTTDDHQRIRQEFSTHMESVQ